MNGMKPPVTYAEWCHCLEEVKAGSNDEQYLQAMHQGRFDWTTGVAERITQRLSETVDIRLKQTLEQLQRDLQRVNGREESLVQALLGARRNLSFLLRVAELPAFPEYVREQFRTMVEQAADRMQASLLESAGRDLSGQIRHTIRSHSIKPAISGPSVQEMASTPTAPDLSNESKTRRRVLLP